MQKPTDLAAIPSDMDNDPRTDEQVISQQPDEIVPSGEPHQTEDSNELANKIAYALDGSGAALPGSTPVVGDNPGKVITKGTTGAGLNDEENALVRDR